MSDVSVRSMTDDDLDEVLDLLHLSLGWELTPRFRGFFEWKHRRTPFGPSAGWVAERRGVLVGVRLFQRWELAAGPGTSVRAVRAVDTATHPDHRGAGIFRTLTMSAVEELTADGVGFVFNTPNDKSMPGYLKMGWEIGGRLPVGLLPRASIGSVRQLPEARVGADRWPLETDVGRPAEFVEADVAEPDDGLLRIRRSIEHLRWRYGWDELGYRRTKHRGGDLIWRLRRRGPSVELTLSDSIGSPAAVAVPRLLARTGADVALGHRRPGLFPAPKLGPIVTLRPLATRIDWRDLQLSMGDVELF